MRILVVTDVPPSEVYSGGLLSKSLCQHFPENEYFFYTIIDKGLVIKNNNHNNINVKIDYKPNEHKKKLFKKIKYLNNIINMFYELYSEIITARSITKKVLSYAEKNDIEKVWGIMQGQTLIRVLFFLFKSLNVPFVLQIWDHLDWWIGHYGIDRLSAYRLERKYCFLLKNCECVGAASKNMEKVLSVECRNVVTLTASLPLSFCSPKPKLLSRSQEIVLGFAGQFYTDKVIHRLFEELNNIEWRISEKKIVFRIFGSKFSLVTHEECNIEYFGYRSQKSLVAELSRCDYLICPYIIEQKYRCVAETSFPSKLVTYLATGVPVIFWGPNYSSPFELLKSKSAAYTLDYNSSENIVDLIQHSQANPDEYRQVSKNSLILFREMFTDYHQRIQFGRFLNRKELI